MTSKIDIGPEEVATPSNLFKKITYFFIGFLILFVCSIEGVSQYTSSHSSAVFCGGVCQPHTQPEQATQTKEASDDQKEPVPPPLSWTTSPANLLALYIIGITIASSSIFIFQRKILIRTAVLRF